MNLSPRALAGNCKLQIHGLHSVGPVSVNWAERKVLLMHGISVTHS